MNDSKVTPVEAQAVPDQPVAVIVLFGDIKEVSWRKGKMPEVGAKLFTRPTTAAAAGVPTGWKLVPIEPTEMMLNEGGCAHALPGPHYIGAQAAKRSWNLMLAASPVAVPGKKDNEA